MKFYSLNPSWGRRKSYGKKKRSTRHVTCVHCRKQMSTRVKKHKCPY